MENMLNSSRITANRQQEDQLTLALAVSWPQRISGLGGKSPPELLGGGWIHGFACRKSAFLISAAAIRQRASHANGCHAGARIAALAGGACHKPLAFFSLWHKVLQYIQHNRIFAKKVQVVW